MQFDQAAVIGVFGANGAGKSTLMDLIAGKVDPTSGRVQVKGHGLGSIRRDERNRLVRHHAQPHLAQPQTGRLAAMRLWPRDWISIAREAVRDLVRRKAPVGDPQVFVYDEPPLEPPYGALLFDRFVHLRDKGNLVFFSAHPHTHWHLKAIRDVCDRYVFIEHGRPSFLNSFEEFMSHPGVADYLRPLKIARDAQGVGQTFQSN
ncbi:MAG: ATP-binding cassette domain-containing protein [Pseudomonadota bacterium]